jgi:hypothetical protein
MIHFPVSVVRTNLEITPEYPSLGLLRSEYVEIPSDTVSSPYEHKYLAIVFANELSDRIWRQRVWSHTFPLG